MALAGGPTGSGVGTPARRPRHRRQLRWHTPNRIRALTGAVVLAAVVLGIVTAAAFGSLSSGFDTLSQQTAPQVSASTDLYIRLSDMDAQAANVLLVGNDNGLSGNKQHATAEYNDARTRADADLQRAAAIGGGDPAVASTVRQVLDNFGQFLAQAGEAMSRNYSEGDPPGRPSATELALYQHATSAMQNALRSTQALVSASQHTLDQAYQDDRANAVLGEVLVVVIGLVLIGFLVALQVFLRRRTRRRLNPAIAAATLLTLLATVFAPVLLGSASDSLLVAKQDAFDSIIALSQAQAASQEAAADQSRFIVDPGNAQKYQDDFETQSQAVLTLANTDLAHYDAHLRTALDAYLANNSEIDFGGYLNTVQTDVSDQAQQWAAQRVIARYQGFELADRQMRVTNASGDLRATIDFVTSTALGYCTYDLTRTDDAIGTLLATKQQVFDQAVSDGTDALGGWTGLIPAVLVVLVAAGVGAGVWPRLSEYHG